MSFSAYRTSSSSRSNSISDDSSNLRNNIRESRLIQPEQWELPEIQQIFEKVKIQDFSSTKKIIFFFFYSFKGAIDFSEVHGILQQLGIKIQRFELTKILEKHDRNKDGQLTKEEFEDVRKF